MACGIYEDSKAKRENRRKRLETVVDVERIDEEACMDEVRGFLLLWVWPKR